MKIKEEIQKEFPSICYTCKNARRTWSEELMQEGNVGCALRAKGKDWTEIEEGDLVAEGWVDLRSPVFGKKSGIQTNLQLITKGIKSCRSYEQVDKG